MKIEGEGIGARLLIHLFEYSLATQPQCVADARKGEG